MTEALNDYDGLLNWDNLQAWIETQDVPGTGPVTEVEKLPGGSQNNIFVLTRGKEKVVLRRPPKHLRANSNDTMIREARVLKAIAGSNVPHPEFFAVCADTAVIGSCFYIMAPLEGFSPSRQLPGNYATDRSWRRAMGEEIVKATAAIGSVDYLKVGLADFGKANDWHNRQVARWRSQLEGYNELPGYEGSDLPHVDEVGEWLAAHVPKDGRIGILHGDHQWPNIMFSLKAPKISGLIDWELSTLGDPMLDLGWVLSSWYEPGDPKTPAVEPWDGFITRADLIRLYGEHTGRDMSNVGWFFVLACYKLGCILEGTYARSKAGQAPVETGIRLHEYATGLFTKAKSLIDAG